MSLLLSPSPLFSLLLSLLSSSSLHFSCSLPLFEFSSSSLPLCRFQPCTYALLLFSSHFLLILGLYATFPADSAFFFKPAPLSDSVNSTLASSLQGRPRIRIPCNPRAHPGAPARIPRASTSRGTATSMDSAI